MKIVPSLENSIIAHYVTQINEKKIKFVDIDKKLTHMIREKILDSLIQKKRDCFSKRIHESIRNELVVATAKNTNIDYDMRMVYNDIEITRECIEDIWIYFEESRMMYCLVDSTYPIDLENVEEEDIIMMSDSYKDLEVFTKENDNYSIIHIESNVYGPIRQYQHPQWENIHTCIIPKKEL